MKRTIVIAIDAALCAVLAAGCATRVPPPQVKPVLEVRHSGLQADGYYQLGRFMQEQQRLDEAAVAYHKALALDPAHADAHNGLGTLYALQGRYSDAHAEFGAARAQAPNDAAVLNNIGYTFVLELRYGEAVTFLQKAHALAPENERYRANLELASNNQSPGTADAPAAAAPVAFDAVAASGQSAASSVPRMAGDEVPARLVALGPHAFELVLPAPRAAAPGLVSLPTSPQSRPVLEVSNGNGATGMARRVGRQLSAGGMKVARLTNQAPYGEVTTHVQYRPGHENAAIELSWRVPGHPPVAAALDLRGGIDVRLVLGRDLPVDVALLPPARQIARQDVSAPH